MNSNRNNNRRRGRGNNRGGNGGQQGNRIDSRARGNAAQMLEKYRKLAHDASLNDDRVQTEYYLQFADHYFRVLADSRSQRDEQRPQRERDGYDIDERDEDEDYPREQRSRPFAPEAAGSGPELDLPVGVEGVEGAPDEGGNPFSPEPRDGRGRRGRKPRREDGGFDAAILPPAIARVAEADVDAEEEGEPQAPAAAVEDAPKRKPGRPRTRRPRTAEEGDDEVLQAVG